MFVSKKIRRSKPQVVHVNKLKQCKKDNPVLMAREWEVIRRREENDKDPGLPSRLGRLPLTWFKGLSPLYQSMKAYLEEPCWVNELDEKATRRNLLDVIEDNLDIWATWSLKMVTFQYKRRENWLAEGGQESNSRRAAEVLSDSA